MTYGISGCAHLSWAVTRLVLLPILLSATCGICIKEEGEEECGLEIHVMVSLVGRLQVLVQVIACSGGLVTKAYAPMDLTSQMPLIRYSTLSAYLPIRITGGFQPSKFQRHCF